MRLCIVQPMGAKHRPKIDATEPAGMEQVITFEVFGEPGSIKNQRRAVKFGNRLAFIKSAKSMAFTDSFRMQAPKLCELLTTPLSVDIDVWYASRRPDLDVAVVLDAMQGVIYANDRQVQEQHIYWNLDRANPRVVVTVRPIQDRAGATAAGRHGPSRKRFKA